MVATHCLPSGSLGTGEIAVPRIHYPDMLAKTPPGARKGVVVMFHGIQTADPPNAYTVTQWEDLATALAAAGWLVVAPLVPGDGGGTAAQLTNLNNDFTNDPAGTCARYATTCMHYWEHLKAWLDSQYPGEPVVIMGLSWGGWYALHVVKNYPNDVSAYAVMVPVTVLSLVSSFGWNLINTTGADTDDHQCDSVPAFGWLGWGTSDTTVGFTHTQAIYNNALAAGKPVTSRAAAHGHSIDSADVSAITTWLSGTGL